MNAPKEIRQGDRYEWTESDSDYPASTYTGKVYLNGPSHLALQATADGDDFDFVLTSAQSAALSTGTYQLQFRAESGSSYYTRGIQTITVIAGGAQLAGYEARNHNRIVLDAINATIEGRATNAHSTLAIGGKQLSLLSMEELITAKLKYERFVENDEAAERVAKGLKSGKSVGVRFVNP